MGIMSFKIIREIIKKGEINKAVVKHTKKRGNIIYGAQAVKAQVPGIISRSTEDYDIYSNKPKKHAASLERNLDRKLGGDFFFVKPAIHPGTWKVVSHQTQKNVADFTKPERKVKTTTIRGVRYVKLSEVERDKMKSLRDPESSFRHKKDRDDLNRIRSFKNIKKANKRLGVRRK